MFHFGADGALENGEVRFQLKATESLPLINKGTVISFPTAPGDLDYWAQEIYSFILVVFDAQSETAYWLHIQEYVSQHPELVDPHKESVHVHIPVSSKLTAKSIETFRSMSLHVVDELRSQGGFGDVERKPR